MPARTSYEDRVITALKELGIPDSFVTQRHQLLHRECEDLVSIGLDMFGREQWLERKTAGCWQDMVAAAKSDGVSLLAISGSAAWITSERLLNENWPPA